MRLVLVAASLVALLVACSSDPDGDECRIEGTYTATGKNESGNCPEGDPNAPPTTDTITKLPSGRYRLEIQGFAGGCDLDQVGTCKLQGKCDLGITDALDPNDRGTVQYSWTFNATGFDGFSAITIPKATSLPDGCSANAHVTGTRR